MAVLFFRTYARASANSAQPSSKAQANTPDTYRTAQRCERFEERATVGNQCQSDSPRRWGDGRVEEMTQEENDDRHTTC